MIKLVIYLMSQFLKLLIMGIFGNLCLVAFTFWWLTCPVSEIGDVKVERIINVVGIVADVFPDVNGRTVYELRDLTGQVFVVSKSNELQENDVIAVSATRYRGSADRIVLMERNRLCLGHVRE